MTKDEAWGLADDWVAAWNKHDLDVIMAHYDDAVIDLSVAAQLLGSADGRVVGNQSEGVFPACAQSIPGTSLPS